MRKILILSLLSLCGGTLSAATFNVPIDYPTIQAGVAAASAGDTVLVAAGSYGENLVLSSDIVIMSTDGPENTTIDPLNSTNPIVTFNAGITSATELTGFTLQHSLQTSAVLCQSASPRIHHNYFTVNISPPNWGGPSVIMADAASAPQIYYNQVDNSGGYAAIRADGPAHIYNNTVYGAYRHGIFSSNAGAVIMNNVTMFCGQNGIGPNTAPGTIDYNVYWHNAVNWVFGAHGRRTVPPMLADTARRDFTLRFDSPLINTGSPDPFYNDPDGTPNDIGCFPYGGKAPLAHTLSADSGTLVPTFYWTYLDTLPTTQQAVEIQVGTDTSWNIAELWSSGQIATADGSVGYGGAPLHDRGLYYFRVRVFNGTIWGSWMEAKFAVQIGSYARIDVPTDLPTIQDALDAAADGDTIVIDAGIFTGDRNVDLDTYGKILAIRSKYGAATTIIDCAGSESDPHHGFHFWDTTAAFNCTIGGLGITNAYMRSQYEGSDAAAIFCEGTPPIVYNCRIFNNDIPALWYDVWNSQDSIVMVGCEIRNNAGWSAIYVRGAELRVDNCIVADNDADGIWLNGTSPLTVTNSAIYGNGYAGIYCIHVLAGFGFDVRNCTVVGNESGITYDWDFPKDGQEVAQTDDTADIVDNVVAFNRNFGIRTYAPFNYRIYCNDVFGNGNDTIFAPPGVDTVNNISLDPQFCDTSSNNFHLTDASPCLPENNACGRLLGHYDVGCDCCKIHGNVDGLGNSDGWINVSDLTYLVAYVFAGGAEPPCPVEADVDGSGQSGGLADVADITYLVGYLFQGGPEPPACAK